MAKYSYEITIPNQGTFAIDSDRELTDAEAYQSVLSSLQAPRTTGDELKRAAGIALRGAAPALTGAAAGGVVGGAPGALVGSFTVPAAEIATQAANVFLPKSSQIPSPTGAVEQFMTGLGLPVPETRGERVLQSVSGGLAGAGTQLATAPAMAKTATSELGRYTAEQLAQQPVRQIAATAPSAAASQVVGEEFGAVPGMAAGMLAAAPFGIGAKSKPVEQIPTTAELKSTASRLYDVADKSGVVFKSQPFTSFAKQTALELRKEGVDPTLTPKAEAALNRLIQAADQPLTMSELERLRRVALIAATSNDAADRTFGGKLIEKIDKFVEDAPDTSFAVKDKKGIEALKEARGLWKQSKKAQVLETIFDVAELRSEANYTQSGMEQALRSRLVNLAANEKMMRGFNKTEQQAIREAAKGGSMQNFFRYVGKLAPTSVIPAVGGAALGTQMFGTAGALGAAAPAVVGTVARGIATKQGISNFQNLENMLRLGRQPRTPVSGVSSVITRGLISPNAPLDVTQEQLRQIYGE